MSGKLRRRCQECLLLCGGNKAAEHKRIGDLTQRLGVAEICACTEIDACQPVYDSTLTALMHVCLCRAHTNTHAVL